jgi:hypothetical protein
MLGWAHLLFLGGGGGGGGSRAARKFPYRDIFKCLKDILEGFEVIVKTFFNSEGRRMMSRVLLPPPHTHLLMTLHIGIIL